MLADLKSKKIGVLCGGVSRERAVSLRSGKNVYSALLRLGYDAVLVDVAHEDVGACGIDVAFNVLHGQYGEDGTMQAYLEALGIPYTGSRVGASVLGINKFFSKQLMVREGVPTPAFWVITEAELPKNTPFPLIAKPVSEGSSVGVAVVDFPEDFTRLVSPLLGLFSALLLEEFVTGQEITVGVLELDSGLKALPILELRPKNRIYDYEAKYTEGMTEFILPAELSDEMTARCQALAIQVHELLGCRGMSRVDMIVHPERGPLVLELNSIPGMTDLSDLPAQAKEAGISFDQLVDIILQSAL